MDELFREATEGLIPSGALCAENLTNGADGTHISHGQHTADLPDTPYHAGHRRRHSDLEHSIPHSPPPPPSNSMTTLDPSQPSDIGGPDTSSPSLNPARDRASINMVAEILGLPDRQLMRMQNLRNFSDRDLLFYIIGSVMLKETMGPMTYKDIKVAPWFKNVELFAMDAMMSPSLIAYSGVMSKRIFEQVIGNYSVLKIPESVIVHSRRELQKAFLEILRGWRYNSQKKLEIACINMSSPLEVAKQLAHPTYVITWANIYRACALRQFYLTWMKSSGLDISKSRTTKGNPRKTNKNIENAEVKRFWGEVDHFLARLRNMYRSGGQSNFALKSLYNKDLRFCRMDTTSIPTDQVATHPSDHALDAQRIISTITLNDDAVLHPEGTFMEVPGEDEEEDEDEDDVEGQDVTNPVN